MKRERERRERRPQGQLERMEERPGSSQELLLRFNITCAAISSEPRGLKEGAGSKGEQEGKGSRKGRRIGGSTGSDIAVKTSDVRLKWITHWIGHTLTKPGRGV